MLGYDFYILLWETLSIFVVTLYLRTQSFTFCVLFKSTKVEKQLLTLCYASISISKCMLIEMKAMDILSILVFCRGHFGICLHPLYFYHILQNE